MPYAESDMADKRTFSLDAQSVAALANVVRRVRAEPRVTTGGGLGAEGSVYPGVKVQNLVQIVSTTCATSISAGTQTVTPASMLGIVVGCVLVIDTGASQESVTVTAITATTFTAVFVNGHAGGAWPILSGKVSGKYTGTWFDYDPSAETYTQQLAQVWISSPNAAALVGGKYYRGIASGPFSGSLVFSVDDVGVAGDAGGTGKTSVQHNGTLVGTRTNVNLIDATAASFTVADNPGADSVDITPVIVWQYAKMHMKVAQAVPNAAWTRVLFDQITVDTGLILSIATGRMTLVASQLWHVTASLVWAANAAGERGIRISGAVSGNVYVTTMVPACPVSAHGIGASLDLWGAELLIVEAFQSSGGALNINADPNGLLGQAGAQFSVLNSTN